MQRILFVCTGNTCRSSMAGALAKKIIQELGVNDVSVSSAGIFASEGEPASAFAIAMGEEMGFNLTNHHARVLTPEIIQEQDLILTMTQGHKNNILAFFPEMASKIFTLKEYISEEDKLFSGDVSDPFGGSLEVYRDTAQELAKLVQKAVLKFTNA